jgi:DNA polymerase-1
MLDALPFREVWAVDFEFGVKDGARPDPVCLVAWELRSGRKFRLWRDQFGPYPPYSIGPDSLFIAYYASAEVSCHLALGWAKPARILDLFTEFRCRTNGLQVPAGSGLLGALAYYRFDGMDSSEKEAMLDLVLRGDWSEQEREAILTYCEQDVAALAQLLPLCSATLICRERFSGDDT